MTPTGKGMFIWKIKDVSGGDVRAIAAEGAEIGLDHVTVKIADGASAYNLRLGIFDDYLPALLAALDDVNITMTGWVYVYGNDWQGEARKAIERVRRFNLDTLIVNAEAEYKDPVKAAYARKYIETIIGGLPNVSIGLSSYRFPSKHPEFPWASFLPYIDFHCPQVYWAGANNPVSQLDQSIAEIRALERKLGLSEKPITPIGAAYHENGWQPEPIELDLFDAHVRELKLPGIYWWEWGHAQRYGFRDVIAAHHWRATPPPIGATLWARVVTAKLNIRSGPGVTFTDIGDLIEGVRVPVYAIHYDGGRNEWLRIDPTAGRWVASHYNGSRLTELIYG